MLSVKLRRHKPTRFFSDELQALILIHSAAYFTYSKYTIIQMCGVRFASSDLYRSKEIQLAKSHSLMIFMRTRHLKLLTFFLYTS